jgi:hypothetical protein
MKNLLLAFALLCAFGCSTPKKKTHVINDTQSPRFLYVLNATSGSHKKECLKLEGIPSAIYFSDRPNRIAGHISLEKFADQWKKEEYKKDPPNGSLAILEEKSEEQIIIELSSPKVKDSSITFKIKSIKGKIPEEFKSCALFIDFDSPGNQYFAYENFREDFHALDCSCGNHEKIRD